MARNESCQYIDPMHRPLAAALKRLLALVLLLADPRGRVDRRLAVGAEVEGAGEGADEGDGEGIVGVAEAAGVLAHGVVVAEVAQLAEGHVGEDAAVGGAHPADDGAERWQVLRGGRGLDAEDVVARVGVAGEGEVGADGVVVVAVGDGADEGEAIGAAGEAGQVFGDGNARDARRDGAELAADLGGGVGFEVEDVEVGGAAVVEDEDAGLGAAELREFGGGF